MPRRRRRLRGFQLDALLVENSCVETLLAAIVGGAGGAILTTLIRIRHERDENFRARLLAAADDFATGLQQALIALANARFTAFELAIEIEAPAQERARDFRKTLASAWESIDAARARSARIELLFGADSPAHERAQDALVALRTIAHALAEAPHAVSLSSLDDDYQVGHRRAISANRAFCRHAREEIRGPAPVSIRTARLLRLRRQEAPARELDDRRRANHRG